MRRNQVSPVFVGRDAELAALTAALDAAVAGDPVVVLLSGEAGVGKTRLVEEAAERASAAGARVLAGSCIEMGGEGLPFGPGQPQIIVQQDAFATLIQLLPGLAAPHHDVGDIQLTAGTWIVGRAVDEAGRPLAGARVSAHNVDLGRGAAPLALPFLSGLNESLDAVTTRWRSAPRTSTRPCPCHGGCRVTNRSSAISTATGERTSPSIDRRTASGTS